MDLAKKSPAELEQIVANAKAALEKGRADGRSEMSPVMRARYRVLGAASAALAGRAVDDVCGFCLGRYTACPSCYR